MSSGGSDQGLCRAQIHQGAVMGVKYCARIKLMFLDVNALCPDYMSPLIQPHRET